MKEEDITHHIDQKELQYYSFVRGMVEESIVGYWIGNPSVQIITGTLVLLPINQPPEQCQTIQTYINKLRQINKLQLNQTTCNERYCLLLNGIPNNKIPGQLLYNSPLSQYQSSILQVRIVRITHLRYYAMLLLFKQRKSGVQCFNDLFGREYNQFQFQRIIFRQIAEVTLHYSQPLRQKTADFLMRKASSQAQKYPPQHIFLSSGNLKIGIKVQEKRGCSICLEQVEGEIISILCGHYFHRGCLQQWQFNTCPLCRYYQQPPVVSFCEQCNQCDGLWVCLVCGRRLCCGPQNDILAQGSHIYQHYQQSGHALSMQVQTKFLFDARVPAFLHQMFYRELVQKGIKQQTQSEDKQTFKKSKLSETISLYEKQVAEEMQKQRTYFQSQMAKMLKNHRDEFNSRRQKINLRKKQLQILKNQQQQLKLQNEQLQAQIQKSEKQEQIIAHLLKKQAESVSKAKQIEMKKTELQNQRLMELQMLIEEKKQDLLNYKNNISLQQKLKGKLKGEKVKNELIFMGQKNNKKKK